MRRSEPGMVSRLAAGRHGDSLDWVSEQAPGRPLSAQVGRLGFGAAMSTARTILGILLRAQTASFWRFGGFWRRFGGIHGLAP